MNYIIKHANGTYYQGMTRFGPLFGATKKEGLRFMQEHEALKEQALFSPLDMTTIEAVEK